MFKSKKQKSIFLSGLSAIVGLLALYVLVTLAAAGDLDTSFAGDGIFTDNIAGSHTQGHAVIVQPDGKIVVGGATDSLGNSALRYAIARLIQMAVWTIVFPTMVQITISIFEALRLVWPCMMMAQLCNVALAPMVLRFFVIQAAVYSTLVLA